VLIRPGAPVASAVPAVVERMTESCPLTLYLIASDTALPIASVILFKDGEEPAPLAHVWGEELPADVGAVVSALTWATSGSPAVARVADLW
jgi:hypothetical protein